MLNPNPPVPAVKAVSAVPVEVVGLVKQGPKFPLPKKQSVTMPSPTIAPLTWPVFGPPAENTTHLPLAGAAGVQELGAVPVKVVKLEPVNAVPLTLDGVCKTRNTLPLAEIAGMPPVKTPNDPCPAIGDGLPPTPVKTPLPLTGKMKEGAVTGSADTILMELSSSVGFGVTVVPAAG